MCAGWSRTGANPAGSGDAFRLRDGAARVALEIDGNTPVAPCENSATQSHNGPEDEMPVQEREAAECHPIHGGGGFGPTAPTDERLRPASRARRACVDPPARAPGSAGLAVATL